LFDGTCYSDNRSNSSPPRGSARRGPRPPPPSARFHTCDALPSSQPSCDQSSPPITQSPLPIQSWGRRSRNLPEGNNATQHHVDCGACSLPRAICGPAPLSGAHCRAGHRRGGAMHPPHPGGGALPLGCHRLPQATPRLLPRLRGASVPAAVICLPLIPMEAPQEAPPGPNLDFRCLDPHPPLWFHHQRHYSTSSIEARWMRLVATHNGTGGPGAQG